MTARSPHPMSADKNELLRVRDLHTYFQTEEGTAKAVEGIDFYIDEGETVALVGESGCGKSVAAYSLLDLVPSPGAIQEGEILFRGRDLRGLSKKEWRGLRGHEIAMVFQEPGSALNPVFSVGDQVAESIRLHLKLDRKKARQKALELFEVVGIPSPEERLRAYPHELSGGMRQRVVIAMAIACDPLLLIADEPTTALDVTIQAQILALFDRLQERLGLGLFLITHDLGIVAERADRVYVMYAGRIVESAPKEELFQNPRHPYTQALLRSLPENGTRGGRLQTIPGEVPDPLSWPSGCRFRERCFLAREACAVDVPALKSLSFDFTGGSALRTEHRVACPYSKEALFE